MDLGDSCGHLRSMWPGPGTVSRSIKLCCMSINGAVTAACVSLSNRQPSGIPTHRSAIGGRLRCSAAGASLACRVCHQC